MAMFVYQRVMHRQQQIKTKTVRLETQNNAQTETLWGGQVIRHEKYMGKQTI